MDNQENNLMGEVTEHRRGHGKRWIAIVLLFLVGIGGGFKYGLALGKKGFVYNAKEFKIVNQKDTPKDVDYSLLWKTLDIVNQKYIDRPIDQEKVLYGAVRGAVAASGDQYTQFFDPKELDSFKTGLKGSFDGIGAEIGKKDNNIVIVAPLDDSPAKKAGLQAKDIIVQVNGESTADWSVEQAVTKIRGQSGTEVTLTMYRQGQAKTFEVKIVRAKIEVKSVKLDYKKVGNKNIAVITLSRFGDDTKQLFDQAVASLRAAHIDGIIVDLRNDPGGYLETAVDIASNWVAKDDLVVTEAHSDKDAIRYTSAGYGTLSSIKTILLINGGSASASEILSGALHDHNLAKLVGEKSFGKGSVQELIDLPDGSAVKVTVAKWITPGGKNLNKDGLVPDVEVKLSDDDIKNQKDSQMDKALEEVIK